MKAKITLLVFLSFIGCTRESNLNDDENGTNSGSTQASGVDVIDFPLLGEARPIDLIEMKLEFPNSLKELDGQRVSMVGFMAPFDSLDDMRRCQIVPSYVGCNFCSPPNLRQVVYVIQGSGDESGDSYSFIEEPSHVTGTFRISLPGSEHEGKNLGFIYSIEDAVVTVHDGDPTKRAPGHGTPAGHKAGQGASTLAPVATADLVREIAEILGTEPLPSMTVELVSAELLSDFIRSGLEKNYPKESRASRSRAFTLLGVLPEKVDFLKALEGFELSQRVAIADESGMRIRMLDSVSVNHPYVRLELVGAIADALIRQGQAGDGGGKKEHLDGNEDASRAEEALQLGKRNVVVRRYARVLGISTSGPPPSEFASQGEWLPGTNLLKRWYTLPAEVGPYFVNFHVGPTGPLSDMESALDRPPETTIEFFRPLWHEDVTLWRRDPVPRDFADNLTKTPPNFTDVLGAGGLMPFLASENSGHIVMTVSGQWAGDRWALWQFPDGSAGLLLETRWQDETAALEFSASIPSHPFQWFFPHVDGASRVRLLRASSPAALNRLIPSSQ